MKLLFLADAEYAHSMASAHVPFQALAEPRVNDHDDLRAFLDNYVAPLRQGLRRVIDSFPRRPKTAAEMGRLLRLDRSSAWRIWQAANAQQLDECALALVGEEAIQTFLRGAREHGAPSADVDELQTTFQRFVDTVESDIGDVPTLRMALAASRPDRLSKEHKLSRLCFDAARFRLGVQAKTVYRMSACTPSLLDGYVDVSSVRQYSGLRTLVPGAVHTLSIRQIYEVHETPDPALDKAAAAAFKPFEELRAFAELPLSTDSLDTIELSGESPEPMLEAATRLNGREVVRIYGKDDRTVRRCARGGLIGKRGESIITYGTVAQAARPVTSDSGGTTMIDCEQFIPAELLIFDVYLSDRCISLRDKPLPMIYDQAFVGEPFPGLLIATGDDAGVLEHYLPGVKTPLLDEVFEHQKIIAAVQSRVTQTLDDCHLFRWRIPMPHVGADYQIRTVEEVSNPAD